MQWAKQEFTLLTQEKSWHIRLHLFPITPIASFSIKASPSLFYIHISSGERSFRSASMSGSSMSSIRNAEMTSWGEAYCRLVQPDFLFTGCMWCRCLMCLPPFSMNRTQFGEICTMFWAERRTESDALSKAIHVQICCLEWKRTLLH